MQQTEEIVKGPAEPAYDSRPVVCPRCHEALVAGHRFCGHCGIDLSGSPAKDRRDPLLGSVVAGRYRLLDKIGTGGMGTVYKVEHVRMGKLMAMKLLHGDLSRDESMVRRFNHEARTVSRLGSTHTVQVFDYGKSEGLVFLVMEYLRGRDLGDVITEVGSLSVHRCAEIMRQIADSLSEAHGLGVIHRDLKPENIFICAPDQGVEVVKVLDFGLAKLVEQQDISAQTLHGSLIGTPYYMSPEQIMGGDLGVQSDIYSLGALLFKLLTGQPPYLAKTPMAILSDHLHKPVPSAAERMPERQAELLVADRVVAKALAKDPKDRYGTVRQLADALKEASEEVTLGVSGFDPGASLVGKPGWYRPETGLNEGVISTREDWERYAMWLRLRRFGSVVLFVVILGGLAYAVYWVVVERSLLVTDTEEEPNDRPANATEIGLGSPVSGTIGVPRTGQRADHDFYRLDTLGTPGSVIDVAVTGVPGIDLVVEGHDFSGRLLGRANEAARGAGEVLRSIGARREPLFFSVREVWVDGIPARSAPNASYEIRLIQRAREDGGETEPNSRPEDAEPIDPGTARFGHINHVDDLDLYVFDPVPTTGQLLVVRVVAPSHHGILVTLVDGAGKTQASFGSVAAGQRGRLSLYVAPFGPQPQHLGVQAASPEGFRGGVDPYEIELAVEPMGQYVNPPSLGMPPKP